MDACFAQIATALSGQTAMIHDVHSQEIKVFASLSESPSPTVRRPLDH